MKLKSTFCVGFDSSASVFSITAAIAQSSTYALQNADIVTVSGSKITSGTIVIRDGLIESVGSSVNVPADAMVIDAKGSDHLSRDSSIRSTSLGLDTSNPRGKRRWF